MEAKARFDAHLAELADTSRAGLAAAAVEFVDGVISRAARYGDHLFHCFDDPRIPANTNGLEQFFGVSKRILRHALACGSTTNSVVANLGAEPLLALHQLRQAGGMQTASSRPPIVFEDAHRKLAEAEAPAIRRRSMVRYSDRHIQRLRAEWFTTAAEPDA